MIESWLSLWISGIRFGDNYISRRLRVPSMMLIGATVLVLPSLFLEKLYYRYDSVFSSEYFVAPKISAFLT